MSSNHPSPRAASPRRRPDEAIRTRTDRTKHCEKQVRTALTRLIRTGAPFTITNVCDLAGVGRTFIYDHSRPDLRNAVIAARNASRQIATRQVSNALDDAELSWRQRALNAEALIKDLRRTITDNTHMIGALTGELYDPDGNHLAETNLRLTQLNRHLSENLRQAQCDINTLQRSLTAARANIQRERQRNVTQLFPNEPGLGGRASQSPPEPKH